MSAKRKAQKTRKHHKGLHSHSVPTRSILKELFRKKIVDLAVKN